MTRSQPVGSFGAVTSCAPAGKFARAGQNESFGLAIGLCPIGLGEYVLDAQSLAGLGEQLGAVGAAVWTSHGLVDSPGL